MSDRVVVILAGGSGKRLSCITGKDRPKQFFGFEDNESLFEKTYRRTLNLTDSAKIFTVIPEKYKRLINEVCPDFPDDNIIIEPQQKNTAPCILFALGFVKKKYPDAAVAFLPSDHYISGADLFLSACESAFDFAEKGRIGIIGIKPTRAETGYGYICCDNSGKVVFYEKPDKTTAKDFVSKGFLWNSGMYFSKVRVMEGELYRFLPFIDGELTDYSALPAVSFDKAVSEKTDLLSAVTGLFSWDDIGSPLAFDRIKVADENGNRAFGDVEFIGCRGCTAVSAYEKLTIQDKNNCFISLSEEGLFCVPKDDIL